MLSARFVRFPFTTCLTGLSRPPTTSLPSTIGSSHGLASKAGSRLGALRRTKGPSMREQAMAPSAGSAFRVGQGVLAGASVFGLGALCYYGMGLSNDVGAIDRAILWSQTTKARIRDTYLYFGGSLVFTAGSAVAVMRSPKMMNLVSRGGWMALIGSLAAMWGTGILCQSLPYSPGFGTKQMAWMLHSAVVGAVIAPMTMLGGPLLLRAAIYTAGAVGSLSMLAICAPSEKFLNMGGPLAMGFGVVFMSCIGSMFVPATTALGSGLYSVALYGGLVLFGMFLLYDTQKIIRRAETHSTYAVVPFDPINNSVGIYMDTINIFIRIAQMLAMGGRRK